MKRTLLNKFITGLNLVSFLCASSGVRADEPKGGTPAVGPTLQHQQLAPLPGHPDPAREALAPALDPIQVARFCEELVQNGPDFCRGSTSDDSRNEALKRCKESFKDHMKKARDEHNLAFDVQDEREDITEDVYEDIYGKNSRVPLAQRDEPWAQYNSGASVHLTPEAHFEKCVEHAQAAEHEAARILQFQFADSSRLGRSVEPIAGISKCTEWMDVQVEHVLGLKSIDPPGNFPKPPRSVYSAYDDLLEARELIQACQERREVPGIAGWAKRHPKALWIGGGVALLATLCLATTAFSGLSFCKQKKQEAETKTPKKKKPHKKKKRHGGGGGEEPGNPENPGTPDNPPPAPEPAPGSFASRTGGSATGNSASPGTYVPRSGDSASNGNQGSGSFTGTGRGENNLNRPNQPSTFDTRPSPTVPQNPDTFNTRPPETVPRMI